MATAAQLITRLNTVLPDKQGRWTDDEKLWALNKSLQRALDYVEWPFLEATDTSITTSAGVFSYAKPTGIKKILGVWISPMTEQNKLSPINRKDREQRDYYAISSTPEHYFFLGDNIHILPVPNGAYSIIIEYLKVVPDMTSTGDTVFPSFPTQYQDDILVWGAAQYLKYSNGGSDISEGSAFDALFNRRLRTMAANLMPRENDRPLVIRDVTTYYTDEYGLI